MNAVEGTSENQVIILGQIAVQAFYNGCEQTRNSQLCVVYLNSIGSVANHRSSSGRSDRQLC